MTPICIKPTDATNPSYLLKSQWVTVNTWQIKEGKWRKTKSLLYSVSRGYGQIDTFILRYANLYTCSGGQQGRIQQNVWPTSYDPAIPLLGAYSQETLMHVHKGVWMMTVT